MKLIKTTTELESAINRLVLVESAQQGFVTVDTEFVRESTYFPKLCLIQLCGSEESLLIDPLEPELDLTVLFDLMRDERIVKVFHAARQDLEIFYYLMNEVPSPIFDTQIAAMVCGYGESVGYEALVNDLAHTVVDKSARFSNWQERPLSQKQLKYALSDVIHLRVIYEKLLESLEREKRLSWIESEMAILASKKTYQIQENDMWRKIKPLRNDASYLLRLQKLAAFREREAQRVNCPRGRLIKDEIMAYAALSSVKQPEDLFDVIKRFQKGMTNTLLRGIFQALEEANGVPKDLWPKLPTKPSAFNNIGPMTDLLRVFLKSTALNHRVAEKLIATSQDLEKLVVHKENSEVFALQGWRFEIFGRDALGICRGEKALFLDRKKIRVLDLPPEEAGASPEED